MGGGMQLIWLCRRGTLGSKGRVEIRAEVKKFTRMVADASTIDSLGKKYRSFGGWGGQLEKWRYCWWL